MATGGDRYTKWQAKFKPDRIKDILTDILPGAQVHAAAVFSNQYDMEAAVRQTLDAADVPTAMYGLYIAFAEEIWSRVRRGISGDSLAKLAATLIAKWVAQGLSQPVLEAIRTQVFSVPAPTP